MNELIGFGGEPNDLAAVVLRAKLAKRYGLFGTTPMWGGVKLHEFYPPLSTVVARFLSMIAALILYFLLVFAIWALNTNPLTAVLFIISYYHIHPLLRVGRFPEALGYSFAVLAYFVKDNLLSGIFIGLAGLSHPIPLLFGSGLLLIRLSLIPYLVGLLICGWWYVPFILKLKKLSFLRGKHSGEKRGKVLFSGIFPIVYLTILNLLLFLFFPYWVSVLGVLWWFSSFFSKVGIRLNHLKKLSTPFYLSDLLKKMPALEKINKNIAILWEPKDALAPPQAIWTWAAACYLLDKGIIVYNGLGATEVPTTNLNIPPEVNTITVTQLLKTGNSAMML